MTPADFVQALESILQHRRVAFSRAAAIAFVESCWELIADDPDVWFWSERFIEVGAVEVQTCRDRFNCAGGWHSSEEFSCAADFSTV
jgi:hypothetical protein